MILIGLNGKIGCGKTTSANFATQYYQQEKQLQVTQLAFATALKKIAIDFLGLSEDDCYTQEGKARLNIFWGMTNREILQRIGTDAFRRGFHEDTWVKILELQLLKCTDPVIIIDDVRFDNEAEMILQHNGMIISIDRPNSNITNTGIISHDSEKDLSSHLITKRIVNDGSLDQLRQKILELIKDK